MALQRESIANDPKYCSINFSPFCFLIKPTIEDIRSREGFSSLYFGAFGGN
jgi:hypothetical protein